LGTYLTLAPAVFNEDIVLHPKEFLAEALTSIKVSKLSPKVPVDCIRVIGSLQALVDRELAPEQTVELYQLLSDFFN
jgi:hypothetical protein